ncbi:Vacuolar morphogenesis protein 6 [Rhizina undulata]
MLNAFQAHSILELGAKDRFRVESLLAYGDKLLLGLSNGTLRVYRVESPDSPEISLSLERQIDKFSRRSIEHIACIKEAQILVVLSDYQVSIYDLNEFTRTENLTKTKGASALAVTSNIERDEVTAIPSIVSRLAVGVKKRLILYSWHDGGFQEGKEVVLSGGIRSLTWASGRKVVAGLAGGFVVVDVQTGAVEEIVSPEAKGSGAGAPVAEERGWGAYMGMGGWSIKPLSTRLGGDELLLVKDTITLYVDSEGTPMPKKRPIHWSVSPDAIAFSYPYLVSINTTKQHLEVRNPSTQTLLQTLSLPSVSILHVPPPNIALVHAGKLFYVAAYNQVWRMCATDYEAQIKELIDADRLDEAISLLEILESVLLKESKEEKLREVQMLKAERLFDKRKYRESLDLFMQVSAPPERVIRLFPKSIAGDLSIVEEEKNDESSDEGNREAESRPSTPRNDVEGEGEGDTEGENTGVNGAKKEGEGEGEGSENEGASQPKEEVPVENVKTPSSPTPASPESKKINAETGSVFNKRYSDTASIFSFGARRPTMAIDDAASETASIAAKHTQKVPDTPPILEGDELKKAANELFAFLTDTRRKLTKYFNPDGTPIDPSSINPSTPPTIPQRDPFEASFLLMDGEAPETDDGSPVRIEKLLKTARLVDTTLFKTYMLTRPSLVGPLVRIQNHCDPEVVSEKLRETGKFNELVDFLHKKELHREALELLQQFGQAEEEDERAPSLHGPQRTVMYLQSLKKTHIDLILEFAKWPLKANPKLGMEIFTADSDNAETLPRTKVLEYLQAMDKLLAIQYLEHLYNELNDMTQEFHTRLVELYLGVLKDECTKARKDEKEEWLQGLLNFLITSKQYRSEKVLALLPREDPDYYEPRAVVLSNMGRHKAALEIYVFKLRNHMKAEEYCTKVYFSPPSSEQTESAQQRAIYQTLLSLYLRPPLPNTQQLEPALGILSRHGARLDASDALKLIPEDIKMMDLENYFQSRIRHANARVSENRIVEKLRKSHLVDVQERLLLGSRNQHIIVGEERVCPVCHKRLGNSVILRSPTGVVMHYGCAQKGL